MNHQVIVNVIHGRSALKGREIVERQHKALLIMASVAVKSFLMAIVATHTFCGDISPNTLFLECYDSVAYVGGSIAAVAIMGAVFGYYMIRIRAFDPIFARIMKADFIVTAMFFAVAFTAPSLVAFKVMIWLYGIWVLGMLLAPFNSEQTLLKKVTQYGSLVALGALLTAHFVPFLEPYQQSFTLGVMVSSILSVFGAGRE